MAGRPSKKEEWYKKQQENFDAFEENIKNLTLDRMNEAPLKEEDSQTSLSSKQKAKYKDIYLKPERHLADGQKFNEKYRKKWEFAKEYVPFIAENKEVIGEAIEIWTHPFGGVGAQFWRVPVNKPVWGPRHLAEQIRKCKYHRLIMDQTKSSYNDGNVEQYGTMVVDSTVNRLNAEPVSETTSIFMSHAL